MLKDGGVAFPRQADVTGNGEWGMTLRDYFAAAALPSLMGQDIYLEQHLAEDTAKAAYAIADAMLAERAKRA